MERLLILACSQRKSPVRAPLPAINRYDGPAFRVLRKFLVEAPDCAPRVLVLSAKFGLIESATPIPNYDSRMSSAIAEGLRPAVLKDLQRVLMARRWTAVAVCVGKGYRRALIGFEQFLSEGTSIEILGGGLGPRLTSLYHWLRFSAPATIEAKRRERGAHAR
jgi:hypothetical protein